MSGLSVQIASSGAQALEVLAEAADAVDLVFTDYNMPGMNGVELLEKIAGRWPRTKFILASGYLDDATRARLEQLNASILYKPYGLHEASEMVMQKLAAGEA